MLRHVVRTARRVQQQHGGLRIPSAAAAAGAAPTLPTSHAAYSSPVPAAACLHTTPPRLGTVTYSDPVAELMHPAPEFTCKGVVNGEIVDVSLADYKGKWVLLLFYPASWTYVCPSELIAYSDRHKEFSALNTQLLLMSTDKEETNLAWNKHPRKKGGLGRMNAPLLSDTKKDISADYGVLCKELGIAHRGHFIINPMGELEQMSINALGVGRSVDESLRLIEAHQFVAEHGEVCPANWQPGDVTLKADPDGSMEYFGALSEGDDEDEFGDNMLKISSKADFDNLIGAGGKVVLKYGAPHCGKCAQIQPLLNDLSDKHKGSISFASVDTTAPGLEALCAAEGVSTIPAFHLYKGGKRQGEPITGYKRRLVQEAVDKL